MFVEAQSKLQTLVIDQRRKTHQQILEKTERMEKVAKENPKVEKTEREIH